MAMKFLNLIEIILLSHFFLTIIVSYNVKLYFVLT